jgi:hypothetical protein
MDKKPNVNLLKLKNRATGKPNFQEKRAMVHGQILHPGAYSSWGWMGGGGGIKGIPCVVQSIPQSFGAGYCSDCFMHKLIPRILIF